MPSPTEAEVTLRRAGPADLPRLLPLVRDYHATEGIAADPTAYADILQPLLAGTAGGLWLILAGDVVCGYVALCFGYSIEFGGRDGFVDEIYVVPDARGRGIGGRALDLAIAQAQLLGLRPLHLEVDVDNVPARTLYDRRGFALRERYQLMTRHLSRRVISDDASSR